VAIFLLASGSAEQLAESKGLRFQRIHDHRFPFTVDYVGGNSHWALGKLHVLGFLQLQNGA
jgi:hypothetical protein